MNAATPERRPTTEQISGLIERVTFHSDESGFCVLRVKVKGQREEVTVIGSLPSVTAGEWLVADGWWVRDKEHGLQFKASTLKTVPPTTVEGIERYLGSGLVKGIGPILAKKLVERFSAEGLNVIEHEPL
jgi:exodeoxyribonuclease V alpha subunit